MRLARRKLLKMASAAPVAALGAGRALADELEFRDVEAQSREFMRWHAEIGLDRAQESVKREALESLPAPCCSDNSAYTCCCPCNISRTIWGLSQYMIAKRNATAGQVRAKVREWIAFIGPNGFPGDSCYTGGCSLPFDEGGCGGMKADNLIL